MNPIAIASYGMMAATRRLEVSAQAVAGGGLQVDQVHEMVEQIGAKQAFKANAQVLRVADEMLGELLDLRA